MIIGVGVDAVDVDRMARALARTAGFAPRVFTEAERSYCDAAAGAQRAERYAARFAAKEAVMKALGVGLGACRLADIGLERAQSGQPSVVLSGTAATLAAARGVARWHVTLAHVPAAAVAVVIAES